MYVNTDGVNFVKMIVDERIGLSECDQVLFLLKFEREV